MSPTHYRLSTRLARHLRGLGLPQAEPVLAEVLVAPGLPRGSWTQGLLDDLLDGRFERRGGRVGLWEWSYGFPPRGEPVVVLDVETTGLSPERSEVIELALIRLENAQRVVFQRLVNPGGPIPPFISRLTGIRDADVQNAPDVYAVLQEAWPMLQGATLIIQNAPFDLGFLHPRLRRLGYRLDNPVVDTMDWARKALPALRKRGLDALAWAFDLEVAGRHRALGDAETTLQVAYEMYYMLTAGKPMAVGRLTQGSL
ncbi:DNA polymerase III PolC-type [Meiothermus luteus]|jgi:DNA polymerase-3 subunit epsilon|uniref:DNA polymerase III PolC-type n=1 Tax=Meiothermus luteus TaxID=2026184 RepID=A0A399EGG1_9DEIN|nr:3'-5' exonuclease [Meiothermus luteus]RIH81332.1 DNA polymerase III PolC-type [Meiothermus luteus]RMH55241.1 MAG: 3'-5' exonuclease [Deinococcota bacterium]